jgi:hypothetical protein
MFVDSNDLVEIKVYYKRAGRHYIVHNIEDYDILDDEEKVKFKLLTVKVRELTWGLYNELNEESIIRDITGNRQWNMKLYKENKLRKILVSWDAKKVNEKGEEIPVPINNDAITKLSPDIAESILNSYDALMFISEEEEKK